MAWQFGRANSDWQFSTTDGTPLAVDFTFTAGEAVDEESVVLTPAGDDFDASGNVVTWDKGGTYDVAWAVTAEAVDEITATVAVGDSIYGVERTLFVDTATTEGQSESDVEVDAPVGTAFFNAPEYDAPPKWQENTAYDQGDQVYNADRVYAANTSDNSGSTAPTHASGTVGMWDYVSPLEHIVFAPTALVPGGQIHALEAQDASEDPLDVTEAVEIDETGRPVGTSTDVDRIRVRGNNDDGDGWGTEDWITIQEVDSFTIFNVEIGTTTSSTVNVRFRTTDDTGTGYVVVTTTDDQPTDQQIKDGEDHTGSAAVGAGSVSGLSDESFNTITVSGLDDDSEYYAHVVQENDQQQFSNVRTTEQFTTDPDIQPPDSPTNLRTESITSTSALALWDGEAEAFDFELRRQGETEIIKEVPGYCGLCPNEIEITGLDADTDYEWRVRGSNEAGLGDWPDWEQFATQEAPAPGVVSFDGPAVEAINATENQALDPLDVSGRFSDSQDETLTFSEVGTWPAGVEVTSAGVIQGTPTEDGTFSNLAVRATNESSDTADSNAFTIEVAEAPDAVVFTGPDIDDITARTDITDDSIDYSGRFASAEALTFTLETASGTVPTGVSLNSAGVLTIEPTADGSATVFVRADTGDETADSNTFTIESVPNQPPVWVGPTPYNVTVSLGTGTQAVGLGLFNDPEGDDVGPYALSFAESPDSSLPAGWSFSTSTGQLTVDRSTETSIEGLRVTTEDEFGAESDPSPLISVAVSEVTRQGSVAFRVTVDAAFPVAFPVSGGVRRALVPGVQATGGIETVINPEPGEFYRVHTFLSSGTLNVTRGGDFEYLVVAGGGGGGASTTINSGGGGGGGVVAGSILVSEGVSNVNVGDGGLGGSGSDLGPDSPRKGANGGNSDVFGLIANGGGGGAGAATGSPAKDGNDGGSGGGGSIVNNGTPGSATQPGTNLSAVIDLGSDGGTRTNEGAGGGGAGGNTATGFGGSGFGTSITGTLVHYGGGGSGTSFPSGTAPTGSTISGNSGMNGTGAGGSAGISNIAGNGGSGIVIIRYAISEAEFNAEAA